MRQLASLILVWSLHCWFQEVSKLDICQIYIVGKLDNYAIRSAGFCSSQKGKKTEGKENAV